MGNCEVVLDELPFGFYMEIEGSIEDILATEKLLGIEHLETESRGYPRLTTKFGTMKGTVMESRFEKTQTA